MIKSSYTPGHVGVDSLGAGVHRADPLHPDHPRHHLIPPPQAPQHHRGGETQVEISVISKYLDYPI